MKQYRANYPRDEASQSDGDALFTGVNCKLAPEKLGEGMVREAVNLVFRDGRAATRAGTLCPPSHNPRQRSGTVAMSGGVDFLVVTIEWDQTNGTGFYIHGQSAVSDVASVDAVDTDGDQSAPVGESFSYVALNDTGFRDGTRGRLSVAFYIAALRSAPAAGEITMLIRGAWASRGDGRVRVTLEPYSGGTLELSGGGIGVSDGTFVHTGGTAGTVQRRILQLALDGQLSATEDLLTIVSGVDEERALVTYGAELPVGADRIWGAGMYTDAARREWMLLATEDAIYRCRDGCAPVRYAVPAAIGGPCEFVAAAGSVQLFRGEALTPWQWDGTTLGEWAEVLQASAGDGTRPVDGGATAEVIGDRLAIPHGLDEVRFSDILEPGKYDPLLTERVVPGRGGALVRLFPYANTALLAFKQRSIHLIEGVSGNLSGVKISDVTLKHGLAAAKAVAQVGADVFYLAPSGVFRVSQVIQDRIQSEPVPVSDPIEPLFRERVNWAQASGAVAAVHGEYFYLALPFDAMTTNSIVLVYNTSSGMWEGWHTFPGLGGVTEFMVAEWNGEQRLWAACGESGQVLLMHAGARDFTMEGATTVASHLLTRGYLVGDADTKYFTRAEVTTDTWRARPLVIAEDSTGATKELYVGTRSAAKYWQYGVPAYDLTNVNDDHGVAGRQDYAVRMNDNLQLQSGVVFDRKAQGTDRSPVHLTARWLSLRIGTNSMRCDVVQCAVEARQVGRQTRRRE